MIDELLPNEEDTSQLAENTGVSIAEEKQLEMAAYLKKEFDAIYDNEDRDAFMATIDRIKRDRIAKPDQDSKSTPWVGASNIKPPVTMEKVNTVYAKMYNNIFADDKLFFAEALDASIADDLSDFIDFFNSYAISPTGMNIKEKLKPILYDIVSLGTSLARVPWIKEEVTIKSAVDGAEFKQTRRHGPQLEFTPLHNVGTRSQWTDIQRSPWIAVVHNLTAADLRLQVRRGYFDPAKVEDVLGFSKEVSDQDKDDAALIGLDPKAPYEGKADGNFEIVEGWMLWDAVEDGVMNECKIFIERESGTPLRAEFNPLGRREIVLGRYQIIPSEFYGIGIGHICLPVQAEITGAHNFGINFMQMALSPIMTYRNGCGISQETEIYPGRKIGVDDLGDIQWFLLNPALYGVAAQVEMMALQYAERGSGASSILTGQSDQTLKSGGGFQANAMLAQQSSSVLNAAQVNISQVISEIGQLGIEQFVLHNDELDEILSPLSPEKAAAVRRILTIPLAEMPSKMRFSVRLAEMDKSDQAEVQRAMQASQIYQQYTQTAMQFQQVIGMAGQPMQNGAPMPENVLRAALQGWVGLTKLTQALFKNIGIENPEVYFPSFKMEEKTLEELDKQKDAQVKNILGTGGQDGMASVGAPAAGGLEADAPVGGSIGGTQGLGSAGGAQVAPEASVEGGGSYI